MTTLLPLPAATEREIYVQRQNRRRWRLSVAAATIVASIIGAITSLVLSHRQENDVRKEIEKQVAVQKAVIDRLAQTTDRNADEIRSIRQILVTQHLKPGIVSPHDETVVTTDIREAQGKNPPTNSRRLPTTPAERAIVKPPMLSEANGFSFALTGCTRVGATVLCHLTVTNNETQRTLCIFAGSGASRVVDEHANEYYAETAQLGSSQGRSISARVPAGVPLNCWLRFRDVPEDTHEFKLLQIYLAEVCFNFDHMIEFRNVIIPT